MSQVVDVDTEIMALEAPLRRLSVLGRETVEEILGAALDDVFDTDKGDE